MRDDGTVEAVYPPHAARLAVELAADRPRKAELSFQDALACCGPAQHREADGDVRARDPRGQAVDYAVGARP
jgi:hypothetical protein